MKISFFSEPFNRQWRIDQKWIHNRLFTNYWWQLRCHRFVSNLWRHFDQIEKKFSRFWRLVRKRTRQKTRGFWKIVPHHRMFKLRKRKVFGNDVSHYSEFLPDSFQSLLPKFPSLKIVVCQTQKWFFAPKPNSTAKFTGFDQRQLGKSATRRDWLTDRYTKQCAGKCRKCQSGPGDDGQGVKKPQLENQGQISITARSFTAPRRFGNGQLRLWRRSRPKSQLQSLGLSWSGPL